MHSQIETRRAAVALRARESKGREVQLAEQLAIARAQLCELGETAARAKEEQMTVVLAESQAVRNKFVGGGGMSDRSCI